MQLTLRFSGKHHSELHRHLFPGDGLEAAAIVLCGRQNAGSRQILTAQRVLPIPHEKCMERTPERLRWETRLIDDVLGFVAKDKVAVLKVHSHPAGYRQFSSFDDSADRRLFPTLYALADDGLPHLSAIMLPDGEMFGRHVAADGSLRPVDRILVAGDDIIIWDAAPDDAPIPERAIRHAQAFGEATTRRLGSMTIGIVGLSGLGGPLVEQIGRYGPQLLVLVDPEKVDESNRNRIPGTTPADVGRLKTEVQARVIHQMGMGTEVSTFPTDLSDPSSILALAECDVVFGCLDEAGGRHLLNRLCSVYLVPYVDLGVRLVADGQGGVSHVCGTVNYLQPAGSSLFSRGLFSLEQVRADSLKRMHPEEYESLRKERYIAGAAESRPAVVSVNTLVASVGALELIARLHPYRLEPNCEYASTEVLHPDGSMVNRPEGQPCEALSQLAGRGDMNPLLDMPLLSFRQPAA